MLKQLLRGLQIVKLNTVDEVEGMIILDFPVQIGILYRDRILILDKYSA
jgi:hypothetical protein